MEIDDPRILPEPLTYAEPSASPAAAPAASWRALPFTDASVLTSRPC